MKKLEKRVQNETKVQPRSKGIGSPSAIIRQIFNFGKIGGGVN